MQKLPKLNKKQANILAAITNYLDSVVTSVDNNSRKQGYLTLGELIFTEVRVARRAFQNTHECEKLIGDCIFESLEKRGWRADKNAEGHVIGFQLDTKAKLTKVDG